MTADLERAHRAAGLRGTLAEALSQPPLARCLHITAAVLAAAPTRPAPAVQPVRRPRPASPDYCQPKCRDLKRAGAADKDDDDE